MALAAAARTMRACRTVPRSAMLDRRDRRVPRLPAPGRVARAGRAREAGLVPRRGLLGPPGPRVRRPAARILLLGLAPAAHGGNRTGRVFTGDRSGDWLFARAPSGRAREPADVGAGRRRAARSRDAYVAAAVRCAPPRQQADARGARPLPAVPRARARAARAGCGSIVALGGVRVPGGVAGARRPRACALPTPRPRFAHGLEVADDRGHDPRLLPPEPAEHLHRPAHRADARRGAARARELASA